MVDTPPPSQPGPDAYASDNETTGIGSEVGDPAPRSYTANDLNGTQDDRQTVERCKKQQDAGAIAATLRILVAALNGRSLDDVPPVGQDREFREWAMLLRPALGYYTKFCVAHPDQPNIQAGPLKDSVEKLVTLFASRKAHWKKADEEAAEAAARAARAEEEQRMADAAKWSAAAAALESDDEGEVDDGRSDKVGTRQIDEVEEGETEEERETSRPEPKQPTKGKAGKGARDVKDLEPMDVACERCLRLSIACLRQKETGRRTTFACQECRQMKIKCSQERPKAPVASNGAETRPRAAKKAAIIIEESADEASDDQVIAVKTEKADKVSSGARGPRDNVASTSKVPATAVARAASGLAKGNGLKRKGTATARPVAVKRPRVEIFDGVEVEKKGEAEKAHRTLDRARKAYTDALQELEDRETEMQEAFSARAEAVSKVSVAANVFAEAAGFFI